jgi:hypothetical protein
MGLSVATGPVIMGFSAAVVAIIVIIMGLTAEISTMGSHPMLLHWAPSAAAAVTWRYHTRHPALPMMSCQQGQQAALSLHRSQSSLMVPVTILVKPVPQLGCTPARQNTILAAADFRLASKGQPLLGHQAALSPHLAQQTTLSAGLGQQAGLSAVLGQQTGL